MRRILLLVFWQFGLMTSGRLLADDVTLKDGSQISGVVESGNTQELSVKVADRSRTIDIHQVQAIQFGASPAAAAAARSAPKSPGGAPASAEPEPDQPNNLILTDGTRVKGRWWSIDTTHVHFLVKGQLQHYPRADISRVVFGDEPSPPSTAHSTPPPATPVEPRGNTAQPARAPASARPSAAPPQTSTPARPAAATPPSKPSRGLTQPDEIEVVYSWNGKILTPLERNKAVERKSGSDHYWEIAGPQSPLRLKEDSTLVFVVYLPEGVNPASYSLFPLDVVNGGRRTRSEKGRGGGIMTWPVDIVKNNNATIITYVFTVRDLPVGEYSFSPSSSNDAYCFGVDPSPGQ